jgi:predicted RNA-binding protein YlxR (DUF448 family)
MKNIRHIPQRTCIACHKVRPKRELIRLVRNSDGSVAVDTIGKRVGRGAYLCPAEECWEIGLKGSRIEHALRTTLTQHNREQLINYIGSEETIDKESIIGKGK